MFVKSILKYVNKKNDTCYLLCNDEECYIFNTNELKGYKARFTDGIHGLLLQVNDEINYILEVKNEFKEIIDNLIYTKDYQILINKMEGF